MKKLLTFFGFLREIEFDKPFIFITKKDDGTLSLQTHVEMGKQDIIDITTQYYIDYINPILKAQHEAQHAKIESKQLIKGLINNVEGVTYSERC